MNNSGIPFHIYLFNVSIKSIVKTRRSELLILIYMEAKMNDEKKNEDERMTFCSFDCMY